MATVIERKKFVCVSAGNNNNKVWTYNLYDNDDVIVSWGRVGKSMQSKTHIGVGASFAAKKVKEKERKGYHESRTLDTDGGTTASSKGGSVAKSDLGAIAKKQIRHSNPEVAKLIDFLVQANTHNIHKATGGQITWNSAKGLFTTPLGIVQPTDIATARDLLVDLGDYVADNKYKSAKFLDTLEEYLRLIPQDIGMKFNPKVILPDLVAVQKQGAILDSLEASYQTVSTTPKRKSKKSTKADNSPQIFDLELHAVKDKDLIAEIRELYKKTRRSMHTSCRYKIKRIFTVEMTAHALAYEAMSKQIGGIKRLWHGTSASNLLSILKTGLKKSPPSSARVSGKAYGNGIYFSSESTKSLNYASGYWGGDSSSRTFMFLADVAMGNYYVPSGCRSSAPPKGHHSYWAQPNKSGVCNSEMIVFDDRQCLLKFLVEFE